MDKNAFIQRRQALLAQVEADSVVILPAALMCHRNADAEFPFRQHSDFYYLSGVNEPDAWIVLLSAPTPCAILFSQADDPVATVWTGANLGQVRAISEFGFDQAYPVTDIDTHMPELLQGRHRVYYSFEQTPRIMPHLSRWQTTLARKIRAGAVAPTNYKNVDIPLHEMRLIKSQEEIEQLSVAATATVAAHLRAMKFVKPGCKELQVEAEMLHEFMQHDCRHPAYTSIVAGGENACVLHYIDNDKILRDGDLLLIDAGAEYQNYAADVTRTIPVNGIFSPEQKAIYNLVLAAQTAVIDAVMPGVIWSSLQETAVKVITRGLVELGILQGEVGDLIASQAYQAYYMHNIGHWLGMDVHDAGRYKIDNQWRDLEVNMVFTVEPGIYISKDADVAEKWRGIGVRIEDDVVVTQSGVKVLTALLPRTVEEIEAVMARSD